MEKQFSALTASANRSNRKEKVRASSLLKVHATGVVGPLTPEERSEWKRRRLQRRKNCVPSSGLMILSDLSDGGVRMAS